MPRRVVEEMVRSGRLGAKRRMRVDLHGFSTFGPGEHHSLIRWESVTGITYSRRGVVIDSPQEQILFPSGVFGLDPAALAARLQQARSIFERGDVLEELYQTACG